MQNLSLLQNINSVFWWTGGSLDKEKTCKLQVSACSVVIAGDNEPQSEVVDHRYQEHHRATTMGSEASGSSGKPVSIITKAIN
jgi:hypothetical protein